MGYVAPVVGDLARFSSFRRSSLQLTGRQKLFRMMAVILTLLGSWNIADFVHQKHEDLRLAYRDRATMLAQALDHQIGFVELSRTPDRQDPLAIQWRSQLARCRSISEDLGRIELIGAGTDGTLERFFAVDLSRLGRDPGEGTLNPDLLPVAWPAAVAAGLLSLDDSGQRSGMRTVRVLVPLGESNGRSAGLFLDVEFLDPAYRHKILRSGLAPLLQLVLVLLFMGLIGWQWERPSFPVAVAWRVGFGGRYRSGFLVLTLGVVISVSVAHRAHHSMRDRAYGKFERHAAVQSLYVHNDFQALGDQRLRSLEAYLNGSQDVQEDEFLAFSRHLLEEKSVLALGWVQLRDDGGHDLVYLASRAKLSGQIDRDLAQDAGLLETLDQAQASRILRAASGGSLFPVEDFGPTELLFLPAHLPVAGTKKAGSLMVAVLPTRMVETVRELEALTTEVEPLDFRLSLLLKGGAKRVLYDSRRNKDEHVFADHFHRPIFLHGQTLMLCTFPASEQVTDQCRDASIITLLVGLLISVLLAMTVHLVEGRQRDLMALVLERTRTLNRSEARFRGVAETLADWIWETDTQGRFTYCSGRVEDITGYGAEELIGKSLLDFAEPRCAQEVRAKIKSRLAKQGPIVQEEHWSLTRDGRPVCLQTSGVPIHDDGGKWIGYRGVDKDVTEAKLAEEERQKMTEELQEANRRYARVAHQAETASAAKSRFLATMSHEIRTPLNGVVGMTALLLDTDLDSEQQRYASAAHSSGESLLGIINDLLDFSKIEAGKLELDAGPFHLEDFMEEFLSLVSFRIYQKDLELVFHLDPALPTEIRGDAGRLRQILMNLVGNAIKFTSKGRIEIRARLADSTDRTARIRFEVIDTGNGIPEDRVDSIFQDFTQVDASTTPKFGGTGLGLAISRQLVELQGGRIGVDSRLSMGSTFHFNITYPVVLWRADDPAGGAAELVGKRVLVALDSVEKGRVVCEIVQAMGGEARLCRGLDEVKDLLAEEGILDEGDHWHVLLDDPGSGQALEGVEKGLRTRAHWLLACPPMPTGKAPAGRGKYLTRLTKPITRRVLGRALAGHAGVRESVTTGPEADPNPAPFTGRTLRLLLVEDDTINQNVARSMLRRLGLPADLARNGQEALECLRDRDYDLVLMDCMMPVMDGYEATRRIRDSRQGVKNPSVPVVAMTANAMKGDREKCLDAGMDDYIAKPLRKENLAEVITRLLPAGVVS